MISLRVQAEAETQAALAGAVAALEGPTLPAELAVVPIRICGDAVRLGLEVPQRLRAWAAETTPALLDDIVRASGELLRDVGIRADAEDPVLATKLRERDHLESVVAAVRRVWLPRPLAQLEAYPALVERLRVWDAAAAAVISRSIATDLLGVRAAFGAGWLQGFADEPSSAATDDVPEVLRAALGAARPSVAEIARYVESGSLRALVEGAAKRDPSFAEELEDAVVGMCAVGAAGFAARAWLKQREKATAEATAFTFSAPVLAHAAAAGGDVSTTLVHRLGTLFPDVDAEARLCVGEREIVLEVDFAPGTLARIELGSQHVTPSAEAETCQLFVARSSETVRMLVRSSNGEEVREDLSFRTAAP